MCFLGFSGFFLGYVEVLAGCGGGVEVSYDLGEILARGFVLVFEGVSCGGGAEFKGQVVAVYFGDFEFTGGNQEVDVVGDLVLYTLDGVEVGGVAGGGFVGHGFSFL